MRVSQLSASGCQEKLREKGLYVSLCVCGDKERLLAVTLSAHRRGLMMGAQLGFCVNP